MQDSESEGSTRLCLGCFDLRPRHQIIYNWKPGGPLFPFSALIWKNTILIWSISARKCDVRGSPLAYHISSCIVCISSKISSNKWYTTINFIRNWTFNLFYLMFVLVGQICIILWQDPHFMRDWGSISHEDLTLTTLFQYFVFMFNF